MPSIPGGLSWDTQDRLQSTDHQGGGVTYYVYDSAGLRVRKVHLNQAATSIRSATEILSAADIRQRSYPNGKDGRGIHS
ncbi:MAG: hypothetical protein H6710_16615 [Myxococcales bacterium]|nr:hypothetical protein [Myxococcales bacterium]